MRFSPEKAILLAGMFVLFLVLGGNDKGEVVQVTKTFFNAAEHGDKVTAQTVVTEKAKPFFGSNGAIVLRGGKDGRGLSRYIFGEPRISDTTAEMPVMLMNTGMPTTITLSLRKELKQWRINAMSVPTNTGNSAITMDFENPVRTMPDIVRAVSDNTPRRHGNLLLSDN